MSNVGKTFEVREHSDANAVLHLTIPVDKAAKTYRVVIHVEAEGEAPVERDANGWPIGFFERIAGQWEGELERAPQGEFEERESF